MTATVQTTPKTFEVNQICEMGWGCPTRYDFFIVTRVSKSNVWLKPISSIRIDDAWCRQWGFQKWNSLPNFKKVDGKNVPITQGKEFRRKIYRCNDSSRYSEYGYIKYQGIICPWDGEVKSNDSMD